MRTGLALQTLTRSLPCMSLTMIGISLTSCNRAVDVLLLEPPNAIIQMHPGWMNCADKNLCVLNPAVFAPNTEVADPLFNKELSSHNVAMPHSMSA